MTIASKLLAVAQNEQEVATQKEAIRQAIIAKDVAVPVETPLNQYPSKIAAISGGGSGGDYIVRFYDYDGTLIKEELVFAGESATAPTQYEMYVVAATNRGETILSEEDWTLAGSHIHEYLIFNSWNVSFDNVTGEVFTGAIYDTVDDATYLVIRTDPATLTLRLYNRGGTVSIDWGDGNVSQSSLAGETRLSHAYASPTSVLVPKVIKITSTGFYDLSYTRVLDSTIGAGKVTKAFIGTGVETVGINAFDSAWQLEEVTLPASIVTLGSSCFGNSVPLKGLVIPSGVTSIPGHAFYNDGHTQIVVLPASVTEIEDYAFFSCYRVNLRFPDSVTAIGQYAFQGCYGLNANKLPDSLVSLGKAAFNGATALALTSLPVGLTSLPTDCFRGCRGSRFTVVHGGVQSIGSNCFHSFPVKIVLEEGVKTLESSWAPNNWASTEFTIPSTVTSIGTYGFQGWLALNTLIALPTTPPTVGAYIFSPTSAIPPLRIYVPDASVSAYKSATNWSTYGVYIYPLSSYQQ